MKCMSKSKSKKQNCSPKNRFYLQGFFLDHLRKFNNSLNQYGLFINDVQGDGNCLFRSVADQLDNNEMNYNKYRKLAISSIKKRKNFYKDFLPEELTIDYYIDQMAKDGTWGGHMELQALAEELGIQIVVHSIESFIIIGEHKQVYPKPNCFFLYRFCGLILQLCNNYRLEKKKNYLTHKTIHIAFHKGVGFQKHYSSVQGHNFTLAMLPTKNKAECIQLPQMQNIDQESEEFCSFQQNSTKNNFHNGL